MGTKLKDAHIPYANLLLRKTEFEWDREMAAVCKLKEKRMGMDDLFSQGLY